MINFWDNQTVHNNVNLIAGILLSMGVQTPKLNTLHNDYGAGTTNLDHVIVEC